MISEITEIAISHIKSPEDVKPVLGAAIRETMSRDGFARNTLVYKHVKRGEISSVMVRKKDTKAIITGAGGSVQSQICQNYVYPNDFYIGDIVKVDKIDFYQDHDLLFSVISKLLEATLVTEDRIWKQLADASAEDTRRIKNIKDIVSAKSSLESLESLGVLGGAWVFGSAAWESLKSDSSFLSPPMKNQLIRTGYIDNLYGHPIITDAHRDRELQVLEPNDIYLVAQPATLGSIMERKEVELFAGMVPDRAGMTIAADGVESMLMLHGRVIKIKI